jgi:hypothetical protein
MNDVIPGFGRYQLLKRLGAGGMAEVFLARVSKGQLLERPVVVKRLLPHLNHNDHFTRMFLDEVRISASLQHVNIVQVFDFGRIESQYFLALEYVWGRSLYDVISKLKVTGKRMPTSVTVAIAVDLCRALEYAHGRKDPAGRPMAIVHRDVSPSNVLLSFEGEVKLADFGIARAADRLMETQSGSLKGKASYMAPEQVRGMPATALTDQFALGIMLYEALSMRALFTGKNPLDTLAKVQRAEIPPLVELAPGLPRGLEKIIMRMLATNPSQRFRGEGELLQRLEQVQRELPPADTKGFMRELFAGERTRDEEEFQRLFARAQVQEKEALHLRIEGANSEELERRYAQPGQTDWIFVPTHQPADLGARVHLVLETTDETACLRVEGQVVEVVTTPKAGMVVRPLPAPVLPSGRNETEATGAADEWLSAVELPKRRRWLAPLILVSTAAAIAVAALVVRNRLDERAAREAFGEVRKSIAAGRLISPAPDSAVDRLLAVRRDYPERPETRELSDELAQSLAQAAFAALEARRWGEAVALLDRRASFALPDGRISAALLTARRGAFATKAGMIQVGEFWIDHYEYPNVAGAPPLVRVDWKAAEDLCQRSGKRLCTESEWQRACAGVEARAYPYGKQYQPEVCVAGAKAEGPQPAGSRAQCVTPSGIADLSGNVAEWTSSSVQAGAPQKVVRGGHWEQSGPQVSCQARDYFLPGQGGASRIGFRCCY